MAQKILDYKNSSKEKKFLNLLSTRFYKIY